jgi:outer membrane protein assembly factor BamE (lipoprotein component of BamABCDE complex)
MKTICFIVVVAVFCVSGCSSPGSQYAKAHPELSPTHRNILITGRIPGGDAVEGMTKEQVKLAMGNPTKSETVNGQDVWIYVNDTGFSFVADNQSNLTSSPSHADPGSRLLTTETMTIYFQGDHATVTRISQGEESQ